jgi:hypothetical protein
LHGLIRVADLTRVGRLEAILAQEAPYQI